MTGVQTCALPISELDVTTEQLDSADTPQTQQPYTEQERTDLSATTTAATATTTAATAPNPATTQADPGMVAQRIGAALNVARRRQAQPGGGGGGGGNPGTPGGGEEGGNHGAPGGGGGPAGPPGGAGPPPVPAPQVGPPGVGDFRLMGTPPQVFEGDRSHAKDFLEDFKAYVRVNRGVPGFDSPIRLTALFLTFVKGHDTAPWV